MADPADGDGGSGSEPRIGLFLIGLKRREFPGPVAIRVAAVSAAAAQEAPTPPAAGRAIPADRNDSGGTGSSGSTGYNHRSGRREQRRHRRRVPTITSMTSTPTTNTTTTTPTKAELRAETKAAAKAARLAKSGGSKKPPRLRPAKHGPQPERHDWLRSSPRNNQRRDISSAAAERYRG